MLSPAHAAISPDTASLTIRSLLLQAHRALLRDPSVAERCIEGAVHLLPEMTAAPVGPEPEPGMAKGGLAPWQILRTRAAIEARLSERISPAELATAARLSRSYFARAFKRSFGEGPQAYINRRRIARAKALMLQSGEPLTAIALACGLADQAHFCRLFRTYEGQSPSAWRRLHASAGHDLALVA